MLSSWSFVVSLVIVLVTTKSLTNGFTIRKTDQLKAAPDLDTGESSLLEIKSDLPLVRDIDIFDNNGTKEGIKNIVIGFNNLKNNDTGISKYIELTEKSIPIQEKPPETKLQRETLIGENITEHSSKVTFKTDTTAATLTEGVTNKSNLSNISTSLTSIDSGNLISNIKENFNTTSLPASQNSKTQINQFKSLPTEITTNFANAQRSPNLITDNPNNKVAFLENHYQSTFEQSLKGRDINYDMQASLKNDIDNVVTTIADLLERELRSTLHAYNKYSTVSSPTTIASTSSGISVELISKPNYTTERVLQINQTNFETNKNINSVTTTERAYSDPPTELQITQAIDKDTEEYITTTLSPWELNNSKTEYLGNNEKTTYDSDITTSETVPISLDKEFSNTTIPSKLFMNLNGTDYLENVFESKNITKTDLTPSSLSSSITQSMLNDTETQTMKIGIFSSKLAGILDHTETPTTRQQDATEKDMDNIMVNETHRFGGIYEAEVSDGDVGESPSYKNTIAVESQSQLAEDAIKEELLMEKMLNENELIKSRQGDVRLGYSSNNNTLTTTEIVTENTLSVKPITVNKRKNTVLYAVSSNYKPLKKLDVQPSKPFIRDPDDNSWRNESISSLGIVFKPKIASKSFTEVLKNKTTELSNSIWKNEKNEVPDLRLRLEKMAEVRKSKKKRINKFGDTVYNDYEESSENSSLSKEKSTSPIVATQYQSLASTTPLALTSSTEPDHIIKDITKDKFDIFKNDITTPLTTVKTKKEYNLAEYYDAADDYDADYVTKIDLKKFTVPFKNKNTFTTQPPETYATRSMDWVNTKPVRITYQPDRQPTVQYFPPTKKYKTPIKQNDNQKVNINDYDNDFKNKVNLYAYSEVPKPVYDISFSTKPSVRTKKIEESSKLISKPLFTTVSQYNNLNKNLYLTSQPSMTKSPVVLAPNDGNFNRASYIIKHYRDFINNVAKENEDEKVFFLFTDSPIQGITMSEITKPNAQKESKQVADYDYDSHFRKDIVNRFIDNFNENSDRFKVDFPIIYNSSVLHTKTQENGKVLASSNAFMKRLYETRTTKPNLKLCDFNCERMTVELSPAYELHYYVPDQEEKDVMQPRTNTGSYRFTL